MRPAPALLLGALLVAVALAGPGCDVGEVPEFDTLRARYGGLEPGSFRLYDTRIDSSFAGAALVVPAEGSRPGGVLMTSDDFVDGERTGALLSLSPFRSPELAEAAPSDRFDIQGGYISPLSQFTSLDGRAEVVSVSPEGGVVGVFWIRVRDDSTPGYGIRSVVEGGFHALPTDRSPWHDGAPPTGADGARAIRDRS